MAWGRWTSTKWLANVKNKSRIPDIFGKWNAFRCIFRFQKEDVCGEKEDIWSLYQVSVTHQPLDTVTCPTDALSLLCLFKHPHKHLHVLCLWLAFVYFCRHQVYGTNAESRALISFSHVYLNACVWHYFIKKKPPFVFADFPDRNVTQNMDAADFSCV